MPNAIVLVLDSFGIGYSHDAEQFGDKGANTYLHIKNACDKGLCEQGRSGALRIPNLKSLGLDHALEMSNQFLNHRHTTADCTGSWGYAIEQSTGKDTSSGHWEMMGLPVLYQWGYFKKAKNSFPPAFIEKLVEQCDLPGVLGNCHGSGTEIIQLYGEEHLLTGKPIVYTSADSVFQIACHESGFGLEHLYHVCEQARTLLNADNIARVIARPFKGDRGNGFYRTENRKDFSMPPHGNTLLDDLVASGGKVTSVGKIADIFANQGISEGIKAHGISDLMDKTLGAYRQTSGSAQNQLIFTNLVDFDTLYGHRRDVNGYARALEEFDIKLGTLIQQLQGNDLLIITADHGCDPTWQGTDHTREHTPVLVYSPRLRSHCLGQRKSFADIGQSLATFFNLKALEFGQCFFTSMQTSEVLQ